MTTEFNIEKAILSAVDREIDAAVEVAIQNAKHELDRRIPEIVAGLSLRVMKHFSVERIGNELVIHVRDMTKESSERTPTSK